LAIVAHCVHVDPQNVADAFRDRQGGRFRTGRQRSEVGAAVLT
jgi:hypothetical protein